VTRDSGQIDFAVRSGGNAVGHWPKHRGAAVPALLLLHVALLCGPAHADETDRGTRAGTAENAAENAKIRPDAPNAPGGKSSLSDLAPQNNADTPVDVVCRAAVALAMAEPERAGSFVTRARLAGWLPELRFRMYRRFARTEGLSFDDPTTGTVAPVDISAIDDVRYEWRATWDLSRMVFNPDELQAHFEALRMADVRRDIQTLVIKLYFERRRLMSETRNESGTAGDSSSAERRSMRVAEIEAQLDAVSDGAFTGQKGGQRRAASSP
jgi:hypothetical protein